MCWNMFHQKRAIVICMVLMSPIVALAATQVEINSTTSIVATPVLKPVISKVDAGACISKDDQFKVGGVNFGSSTTRTLALKAGVGVFPATIVSWSEKSNLVSAKLPTVSAIKPGQSYPVVIIQKSNKQILSNTDKNVKVCAIQASVSLQQSPAPVKAEVKIQSEQKFEQEPSGGSSVPAPTAGSLIGGLPQPSFIPDIKEEEDGSYEQGELVVISNDMEKSLALENLAAGQGHRIKRRRILQGLGFIINVVGLAKGTKVADALKLFQQLDKSLLIDANHRYSLQAADKDPHNPKLHEIIGWGKTSADCGKGVNIGVIDSLANNSFKGFRQNQIVNKSLLSLGVKPADKEHATAIASILGGQPGSAVNGLLPGATIYVAGVFRKNKDNAVDTTAELIINGLNWLQEQGVHAVNMSIAGPRNLLLEIGIKKLLEQNVPVAAAVGNEALENISKYPAAIDGVVGVTAVDSRNRIYNKANRGKFVEIAAPGVDIWAARGSSDPAYLSGTSYATPYVSAALAVLKLRQPALSTTQLVSQLTDNSKDLGLKGTDTTFGKGLLQFKACP